MRILHVMISPRNEGTTRLVLDWLTVKEYHQDLLFLDPKGELRSEFESTGVWQYYNTEFPLGFKNALKVVRLLKQKCIERKPDIVISWPTGFSQWIHLGAKKAGVNKLLVHAGNPPSNSFFHRYISSYLTFWIGNMLGNRVITCSDYVRDRFVSIPLVSQRQFVRVYNCFRPERFQLTGLNRNSNQAIMVATLEDHKDHETLIRAWHLLESKGLPYTLLIAGDGSLRAKLVGLVTELGLKNVQILGSRTDVPKLLNESKLFIFSTTTKEGFGTVLLEALAAGNVVVASDVPACREVLKDGKYGTLVKPGDSEELARIIEQAFVTELSAASLDAQRHYVDGFSPQTMMNQYISISQNAGR